MVNRQFFICMVDNRSLWQESSEPCLFRRELLHVSFLKGLFRRCLFALSSLPSRPSSVHLVPLVRDHRGSPACQPDSWYDLLLGNDRWYLHVSDTLMIGCLGNDDRAAGTALVSHSYALLLTPNTPLGWINMFRLAYIRLQPRSGSCESGGIPGVA